MNSIIHFTTYTKVIYIFILLGKYLLIKRPIYPKSLLCIFFDLHVYNFSYSVCRISVLLLFYKTSGTIVYTILYFFSYINYLSSLQLQTNSPIFTVNILLYLLKRRSLFSFLYYMCSYSFLLSRNNIRQCSHRQSRFSHISYHTFFMISIYWYSCLFCVCFVCNKPSLGIYLYTL